MSDYQKKESDLNNLKDTLNSLKNFIIDESINIKSNSEDPENIQLLIDEISQVIDEIIDVLERLKKLYPSTITSINKTVEENLVILKNLNLKSDIKLHLTKVSINIKVLHNHLLKDIEIEKLNELRSLESEKIKELELKNQSLDRKINEIEVIKDDLKNKKVHEIFADDSENFKNLAKRYEIAFYMALTFLFLYFFGWYVEINTNFFKFKLAEQFYENHSTIFYIQKVSLLILSTTLAAFLLKRSFMNRRLADEAYRTAKELDALPRYMEGMPDEMKEKIRFDLAYKYFGNGIHHESYTGGENLMHENIKANTDFIKAVKDLKTPDSGNADSQGK